ncbi:hypothetical protein D3C72_1651730 [compost metagenome]
MLQAAPVARRAWRPVPAHRHLAEFAREAPRALVEPAIEDEPRADARADPDGQHVVEVSRRAVVGLAERRHRDVVGHVDRPLEALGQHVANRHVVEVQIGREDHAARLGVDQARDGEAHAEDALAPHRGGHAGDRLGDEAGNLLPAGA